MKILFINDPNPEGQDQLADSLLHGFVRAFGQQNVREFYGHRRYYSDPEYLKDWPIHLGALAYGERQVYDQVYDIVIANTRALHDAETMQLLMLMRAKPIILISSGDSPEQPPNLPFKPALVVHRPGNAWEGYPNLELFISVPSEWFYYHRGQARRSDEMPIDSEMAINGYAAMSDNHPLRREVLRALGNAHIPCTIWRFGSGSGYKIPFTMGTVPVPKFLRELSMAHCVVNVRGGNIDTMCVSETFIAGKLLITTPFGGDDRYIDCQHCVYYNAPEEVVEKVAWAIAHPGAAREIAKQGAAYYRRHDTPECQAVRIMVKAGLIK